MIGVIRYAIGMLMFSLATAAFSGGQVHVWVVLTERPVATSPVGQLEIVKQQQDQVMAQLKTLGATELARVTHSSNALAITIDSIKLPEVKRISGVRSVAPVQHIERDPAPIPPPAR